MPRRLVLKMSMSLDGFVAGPNGEMDWWQRSRSEDGRKWVEETLLQAGLHAIGSRTFFAMAGFWATAKDPIAAPMNEISKVVFTRQQALDLKMGLGAEFPAQAAGAKSWAGAEVANGDLATEVNRLKELPGKDILAHGGASFARSLVAAGLVDEFRLVVHPVALGNGMSLFSQLAKPLDLELRETTVFRSGAIAHVYRPR